MNAVKSFIFIGFLFSFLGCSASNQISKKFNFKIIVSTTTQKEIKTHFGSPNHVKVTNNDSDVVWMYSRIPRIIYKGKKQNKKRTVKFSSLSQQDYFVTTVPEFDLIVNFNSRGIVTDYSILPIEIHW